MTNHRVRLFPFIADLLAAGANREQHLKLIHLRFQLEKALFNSEAKNNIRDVTWLTGELICPDIHRVKETNLAHLGCQNNDIGIFGVCRTPNSARELQSNILAQQPISNHRTRTIASERPPRFSSVDCLEDLVIQISQLIRQDAAIFRFTIHNKDFHHDYRILLLALSDQDTPTALSCHFRVTQSGGSSSTREFFSRLLPAPCRLFPQGLRLPHLLDLGLEVLFAAIRTNTMGK